jgi:hypothetical protein
MATPSNLGENLLNGRDLAAARDAYQQGDAEASKTAHMAGAAQRRQNASSAVPKPVIGASLGARGGSGQLGPPRERPVHRAPRHCLGCSSEPRANADCPTHRPWLSR